MKSIYGIKLRLQFSLNESPYIASSAREASMSEPKLRKMFKQTFGKGVFEQHLGMKPKKYSAMGVGGEFMSLVVPKVPVSFL